MWTRSFVTNPNNPNERGEPQSDYFKHTYEDFKPFATDCVHFAVKEGRSIVAIDVASGKSILSLFFFFQMTHYFIILFLFCVFPHSFMFLLFFSKQKFAQWLLWKINQSHSI